MSKQNEAERQAITRRAKEVFSIYRQGFDDCRCTCGWIFDEAGAEHEPTCALERYWDRAVARAEAELEEARA